MPSAKNIAGLFREIEKSFLKHLKSSKEPEEEEIHKLRVSVKRIRSLLSFLKFLSGKNYGKPIDKLISPVFKSAGKIRTVDLNVKLLQDYRSTAVRAYSDMLKKSKKRYEKNFIKERKTFEKKEFEKESRNLKNQFAKLKPGEVTRGAGKFVEKIFGDINSILPGLNDDDNFHLIRKHLKSIKTIEELMEDLGHSTSASRQLEKIKTVEEKIGHWHDSASLVDQMEDHIRRHHKKGNSAQKNRDIQTLAILVTDLKAVNERKKKEITAQLKKVMPSTG